jgi:antitoxin VapB
MKFTEKEGDRIILTPRLRTWREYFESAPRFPDDYPEDIGELPAQEREPF